MMKNVSRKISYLLRHNPEDLQMDKNGWVRVEDLLEKLQISQEELDHIVDNNDKKRFGYSPEKHLIRANQGHSAKLGLKIDYKEVQFPHTYYHGTVFMNLASIEKHGLKPMSRSHVHLSKDVPTARKVAERHLRTGDTYLILEIDGNQMKRDGYKIYESENGVILVDEVPPKYISRQK